MQTGTSSATWTPPHVLEEYRLLQVLARGAGGLVYLAQDTLLDRLVTLKFLLAMDPDAVGRFLVEARATARLQHPNVVTLHRVGQLEDRPFLVSEFVRGTSLAEVQKPMPWRRALDIGLGIARGLAAAHRRGVVHGELASGNVIVGSAGEVKVLDFGLAGLETAATVTPEHAQYYLAPERWRREPATRRADVYSLGALLYELCCGRAPNGDVAPAELAELVQRRTPPPCASLVAERAATFLTFANVIDRCLEREAQARFASAEEALERLEQLNQPVTPALPLDGNPYRGLQPFDREHRALFFGRGGEIRAVVERLRSDAFVLIVGVSGVGKSSFAAAGVLPAVTEGALEDGRSWTVARLKPGRNPLGSLSALVAPLVGENEDTLDRELRTEPLALSRRLRKSLGATRGLVIFVDQLEELLTLAVDEEAQAFARVASELAGGVLGVRLVATMRSDFLMRLAALPELGDHVSRALYLLRPLSESGLHAAIIEPARARGILFEPPALIESLVTSTLRTDGGLPLLQFTLAQLWEVRDRDEGEISKEALERIGGLAGALERHADEVVAGMLPDERAAARRILCRLITVESTRAVRPREELATSPAAAGALDALVRGRLVVARDGERGVIYELAHEALLSGWGTLRAWLAEELELRKARERLELAARQWDRLLRPDDALWGVKQRHEVELLDRDQLAPLERDFLRASLVSWQRARLRRRATVIGLPLLVVALYGVFIANARHTMRKQVKSQLARAAAATANASRRSSELAALEQRAFAAFDGMDVVAGERDWSAARALTDKIDDDYARAGEALETALVLDVGDADVRRATAALIDARARFDEDTGRPISVRATAARLALHDAAIATRFLAPVHLRIETTPPATLRLYRYNREQHYRLDPVDNIDLAREMALPPGSYLVEAQAPDRATVRESLLLERGRDQTIQLTLPPANAVPAGFVYVPEGTFRFGTAGDESLRREFYRTAPLHLRHTNAFLIARHETTYADWIEFLKTLSPTERAKRLPKVAARGFHGSVALVPQPGNNWQLRFQVTTHEYQASSNEKIVYESRPTARAQNWLRFPVSGIGYDDALAYVRWLSRSGRVPGARLCREDEWERAARGADGRSFPHGDELRSGDANWDETYDKQPLAFGPDEVGLHPASDSPFGVSDMAGNVWEWTDSVLKRGEVVARGGSFYFSMPSARADNREAVEPTLRDLSIGIRVCADPSR